MAVLFTDDMRKEVIFTYAPEDDNGNVLSMMHFLVDRMNKSSLVLDLPITGISTKITLGDDKVPLTLDYVLRKFGVEQPRLDRLTPEIIYRSPVLIIDGIGERGDQQTMIDGNHRLAKAMMLGIPAIPGRIVPPKVWEQFRVDIPWIDHKSPAVMDYLLRGYSGIQA